MMEIKRNTDGTFELRAVTLREATMLRRALLGHAREIHFLREGEHNEERVRVLKGMRKQALDFHKQLSQALDEGHLAPEENFQDRGETARQAQGIDGTAGDAQDIPHRYEPDPEAFDPMRPSCLLCGFTRNYSKHT